ncbi:DppF1 [Desulforapulum autotrophicum HRM2]|uniref:DppF1 n=1 Tax=Desulforapulum autotrophicum (strain ATCC 43914 / DSM 3382 / VKM B-1955 / HRM2) TaxID=177437 RepID=C0QJD4_DESAH|nr:ABC transporter ATP-binding protein [Desulforapulum autotrophicum]ACN15947.1 DppF1 [Desulforapulum autotrophicum HRM2]
MVLSSQSPILSVDNVKKYFPVVGGVFLRQQGWVHAVDRVSLEVHAGETLGLVGESGCGKTTLGRCIMGLYPITSGAIRFKGQDLSGLDRSAQRRMRLKMQMIFQDPFESLNQRHTVRQILGEKYWIHKKREPNLDQTLARLLETVGLGPRALERFPHEFSGGQRQRIGIARAISLGPELIVCDEPVSALDVSVQSQILNLLLTLQKQMGLTYLFISHDLSVVRHVSDRIAVMYLGRIVEMADRDDLFSNPSHPYTRALLSAIPVADPSMVRQRTILKGEIPSPENPPKGCRFHTRCPEVMAVCKQEEPRLQLIDQAGNNHFAACHLLQDLAFLKK